MRGALILACTERAIFAGQSGPLGGPGGPGKPPGKPEAPKKKKFEAKPLTRCVICVGRRTEWGASNRAG